MNMVIASRTTAARKNNTQKTIRTASPFRNDPTFRKDLVERIKREIAEGTYETEEKWELALSRLFGSME